MSRNPQTAKGRALAARLRGDEPGGDLHGGEIADVILAIEAEAAQRVVERIEAAAEKRGWRIDEFMRVILDEVAGITAEAKP